ncbi:MAG: 2-hydroxyacyl-CoA dehydratase [Dehalococcoidales bacterium]|nr:2-hydroxyacyl-CoA dehydratase [Dehalococcoidales bacterium]
MDTIQNLLPHFKNTLMDYQEMKNQGKNIIGFVPNGYMPEELIHACGAVPVALARGGDTAPVAASTAYLARFLDPYCRAQIGYRVLNEEPLYQMLDLLIVPITDNHVRAIADSWDFYTDVEVYRLGVPHVKAEHGFEYYLEGLQSFREYLETFTGTEITESALREEINIANEIRELLKDVSSLRKHDPPPISGKEFIELNHSSFYTDRHVYLENLRSLKKRLEVVESPAPSKPRVLLAGSTMALGDTKVVDLLEAAGASVVVEEFSEGLRDYRQRTTIGDNIIRSLAESYFTDRIPGAFFRGAARQRIEYLTGILREFNADAVVWYTLMYRESYDVEGHILKKTMEKLGIPILFLSSDYDNAETGSFKTRIETFVDMIR